MSRLYHDTQQRMKNPSIHSPNKSLVTIPHVGLGYAVLGDGRQCRTNSKAVPEYPCNLREIMRLALTNDNVFYYLRISANAGVLIRIYASVER